MNNETARLHMRVSMPLLALILDFAVDSHSLAGPCLALGTFLWAYLITRAGPEPAEYLTDSAEDLV